MKKWILLFFYILLVAGCEEKSILISEDFEIKEANWDSEIEIDCEECDKPVCHWDMAWEIKYQFSPRNGKETAVCWYYVNNKIEIAPIYERNKMVTGVHSISDPNLLIDCWEDHKVGLCCAYSTEELLDDEYICKDVLLEALCT